MANFQQRIYDALGAADETILTNLDATTQKDILTQSLWTVARQIPADLLLSVGPAPSSINSLNDSITDDYSDKVILNVQKGTGTENEYVNVKEIPITESHKSLDDKSIYKATDYSPVYWMKERGKIQIAPDTANVQYKGVQYYAYSKQTITALDDEITNFPEEAMTAVAYLAVSEMIYSALHTFSEEESPEEYAQWKTTADQILELHLKEMKGLSEIEGEDSQ